MIKVIKKDKYDQYKFRAWDKEKQFMFTPTNIELKQGENFAKWDKWRPMAWRDELPEEGPGGIGRSLGDECELMIYTGILDKQGKEIFEGDVISYYDNFSEMNRIATVRFAEGGFVTSDWWLRDIGECKVIGNIYENPELIVES
ncbi:YopX family protein, partial [Bacillus cereus]|nr:YopX family protein [Bacillus cereus]MDA2572686.1 YopX family protein [Bacillus cereus]